MCFSRSAFDLFEKRGSRSKARPERRTSMKLRMPRNRGHESVLISRLQSKPFSITQNSYAGLATKGRTKTKTKTKEEEKNIETKPTKHGCSVRHTTLEQQQPTENPTTQTRKNHKKHKTQKTDLLNTRSSTFKGRVTHAKEQQRAEGHVIFFVLFRLRKRPTCALQAREHDKGDLRGR